MTIQSTTSASAAWSNPITSAVQKADTTNPNGTTGATVPAASGAGTATTTATATATGATTGGHHHHHHHGGGSSSPATPATTAAAAVGATGGSPVQAGSGIGVTVPGFAGMLLSALGVTGNAQGASGPNGANTSGATTGTGPTTLYL